METVAGSGGSILPMERLKWERLTARRGAPVLMGTIKRAPSPPHRRCEQVTSEVKLLTCICQASHFV